MSETKTPEAIEQGFDDYQVLAAALSWEGNKGDVLKAADRKAKYEVTARFFYCAGFCTALNWIGEMEGYDRARRTDSNC